MIVCKYLGSEGFCAPLQTTAQLLLSDSVSVTNHDKYIFKFLPEITKEEEWRVLDFL